MLADAQTTRTFDLLPDATLLTRTKFGWESVYPLHFLFGPFDDWQIVPSIHNCSGRAGIVFPQAKKQIGSLYQSQDGQNRIVQTKKNLRGRRKVFRV